MLFLNDVKTDLPELLRINGEKKTLSDYKKRRVWVLSPDKITINEHAKANDEDSVIRMASGPASVNVMTQFTYYDKEGKRYTLRYAENHTPATALKDAVYIPTHIRITHSGFLMVQDPELNYFMEHCPNNGSIPAAQRPANTEVLFLEYNPSLNAKPHIAREKAIHNIKTRLFEMSKQELVSACLKARDNNQPVPIPDIELADEESMQSALLVLLNQANDPMEWMNSTLFVYDNMILLAVKQGKENGNIEFDIAKREWKLTNPKVPAAKRVICKVDPLDDPGKKLVDYLQNCKFERQDEILSELSRKEAEPATA